MVQARVVASRVLYWGGILVMFAGIWLVLSAGRETGGTYGPSRLWIGFAIGLLGLALTARGATLRRY